MEPLEIKIPLKVSDQDKVSLKVKKEKSIKLKVSEGIGGGGTYPVYEGPFIITPKPYDDIVLSTTQKTVMNNITVLQIPHYETSNLKGKTFIIGG